MVTFLELAWRRCADPKQKGAGDKASRSDSEKGDRPPRRGIQGASVSTGFRQTSPLARRIESLAENFLLAWVVLVPGDIVIQAGTKRTPSGITTEPAQQSSTAD